MKPELRARRGLWERIERQEHPLFFYLGAAVDRYRLREDSVIAVGSLGSVHRSAVLGATGGELSARDLRAVSERLAGLIELDLGPRVSALARELLERGGFAGPG